MGALLHNESGPSWPAARVSPGKDQVNALMTRCFPNPSLPAPLAPVNGAVPALHSTPPLVEGAKYRADVEVTPDDSAPPALALFARALRNLRAPHPDLPGLAGPRRREDTYSEGLSPAVGSCLCTPLAVAHGQLLTCSTAH